MITREQALKYLKDKFLELESTLKTECFYVTFHDARELIGTIRFLYHHNLITQKERNEFIHECFDYENKSHCYVHMQN